MDDRHAVVQRLEWTARFVWEAPDRHGSAVGTLDARDDRAQSRLTRAVLADEPRHAAAPDREVNALEDEHASVLFAQSGGDELVGGGLQVCRSMIADFLAGFGTTLVTVWPYPCVP